MNKRILTVAVAALALAACSKNETVEVAASKAIGFDAFAGKVTRAVNDITSTENTLTEFYVFGGYDGSYTNVFNNEKTSGQYGGEYNTENTQYWIGEKTYSFVAYSDGNGKLSDVSVGEEGISISDYVAGEKDLLVSAVVEKTTPTLEEITSTGVAPVALKFKHLLSKVKFTFTTDANSGHYVEISNLTFSAPNTASYANDAWGTASTPAQKNFYVYEEGTENLAKITGESAGVASDECYVIPQANDGLTVSFTATLKDQNGTVIGQPKTFQNCPLASGDLGVAGNNAWVSGYGYNYAANVTESEILDNTDNLIIKFTASVEDWNEVDAADTDIT